MAEGKEKVEKKSLNSLIIHPDIEPGVIDNAMLIRCILEYGKLINQSIQCNGCGNRL